jgi:quinol monooxygenase YgiN
MDARMIILAGTVRVPPENIERARPNLEAMVKATRAEPGCIAYAFSFDVLEPGLMRIFEIYENMPALEAHWGSPHMATWRACMPGLGIGDRNMTKYEISGSEKV